LLATIGGDLPMGAQAAAPLLAGDELLGVLSVNFRSTKRFSLEDESLLLAIGRQCGQAIERARLFEAERRARERATKLRELASALAAAASPREVADVAALTAVAILGSRKASIGAITADGRAIEMIAAEGRRPHHPGPPLERIGLDAPSPWADAVGRKEAVLLASPEELDRRYPDHAAGSVDMGDRAWAYVSLEASGNVVGVLFVSYGEPRGFDELERAELEAIAAQVAQALERSLLQQAREEALRLAARVDRVKAVSGAMSPDLGVEEVADAVLTEAAEALGAVAGVIGFATPDRSRLEVISTFGVSGEGPRTVSLAGAGAMADAFRSGEAVLVHGFGYRGDAPEPELLGQPVRAMAATPISAGTSRIGVIGLGFDRERSFSSDELRFVQALAEEAGEALELARLFEAEQRALRRAARLQEVTARLARAVTTEDAARAILRAATGGVGADAASIALASDDGQSLRVTPGLQARGTFQLRPAFEISMNDRAVLAHVYRNGRALWIPSAKEWASRFEEGFATQSDLGRCLYAVPIVARGEAIGALAVYFQQERPEPSAEDVELIRSFAHQAGVALERARAYEVEHEAAMTLQRNLMPEGTGYAANVDVDGRYLPATRGVHVGGDWYDIVDRPDGTVAFAVGDIAGHGLQAAAAMGQVRSAWRALALSMTEPSAILASLDRFAIGVDGAFFSTILTLLLDPARNELRYASAGHPPALVIEPGGSTRFLEGGRSVPLGLPFDLPRPQANERLAAGSILVVYTDGLVERRDESLDRGLERLAEIASRVRAGSLTEISDALLELVADDRHDDVALLTIGPRRPAEVFRRSFPADAHELATMRAELRAWLERSGLPSETQEDVVLACTEAATNAIEHAYIGRGGDVLIEAESEEGRLQVAVTDHGRWRHPRPDDSRGRGLDLVRAVIGDIDVERGETGTTVRMRVGIP
jgi:GAF domain-containing protein/anti-sigma regulatory factor (Ser/Thr protein kinase)